VTETTPAEREEQEAARRRERFGLLLCAVLAAFVVQGVSTPNRFEQIVVTTLLAASLLLSFWAADVPPRLMRPLFALAALLVVASIIDATASDVGSVPSRIANLLLVIMCPPAIVAGVIRSVRHRESVTVEAVFGVLCLYILLGMFFAFVYGAVYKIGGGHFFAAGQQATPANCLYFSFTTLTTVGYGDFTAASNLGHTLSVFEALLGQIYLVTVVSLIVGNLAFGGRRSAKG
jgi:Ion channel